MSTILMIASVVLGCLIAVGIVFIFKSFNWRSPKGLMFTDDGDGNIVFENRADESGAIYYPAKGEVEVFLFMQGSYSETFKAADLTEAKRIYWDNIGAMQKWFEAGGTD